MAIRSIGRARRLCDLASTTGPPLPPTHHRRPTTADQSDQYLSHLGFTLIALLVGFVAIAVLDLGAPGWLAAAAGAGCIAAGHFRLEQIKNRARQMRTRTPAPTVGNPR